MNPVLFSLAFYSVNGIELFLLGGLDDIYSYDFATRTLPAYSTERIEPVVRQKVDGGPVVLELSPAVHVNCLSGVVRRKIDKVEREYRWYLGASDVDEGPPPDGPANALDNVDDTIA